MPSFTNSYTEPGTYVVINDDVITQTNTGLLSVCIIGTGKRTKSINNLGLELIPPTDSSSYIPNLLSTNFSVIPEWVSGTTYDKNDYVVHENKVYICVADSSTSSATFDDADWNQIETITEITTKDMTVESGTIASYSDSYYICNTKTEFKFNYQTWTPGEEYKDNDFVIYNESYFNCIESHVAVDNEDKAVGAYWTKYWKEVFPISDNYSARIPDSDIYPILDMYKPSFVVGGITTRVYSNTAEEGVTYFEINTIQDNPSTIDQNEQISTLVWTNEVLPKQEKNPQGRMILNISYTAEKIPSDGKIRSFTRLSNIFNTYGAPSAENTISTAAQIAYDNGATVFYCVQPLDDDDTDENNNLTIDGLRNGLAQARNVDTYCILPMIDNGRDADSIAGLCKAHVETMSSTLERKERICIISDAARVEDTIDDIEESIEYYKTTASAIDSPRVLYVTPSSTTISLNGETVAGSGMYAAAAIAGIICNNNFTCGEPITGKTLADVAINDKYTREEKNQLASYGCLVLEGAEGTTIPKIRHALSTATGDYVKSEIKITKIKDVISSTLRLALDRAYINTRFLGASTISEMTTTVNTILSSFLANNDIYSYNNLVIAQDQNYPNQVNVSFRIAPAVDLNYVLITFGVTFQE